MKDSPDLPTVMSKLRGSYYFPIRREIVKRRDKNGQRRRRQLDRKYSQNIVNLIYLTQTFFNQVVTDWCYLF